MKQFRNEGFNDGRNGRKRAYIPELQANPEQYLEYIDGYREGTAYKLLKRAADMLQDFEEGDYNNALAMEIYDFLEPK